MKTPSVVSSSSDLDVLSIQLILILAFDILRPYDKKNGGGNKEPQEYRTKIIFLSNTSTQLA